MSQAAPLLERPRIHVQHSYRTGMKTAAVINTLGAAGVAGAGIYEGVSNGWNQKIPYIIFAIATGLGLNALHNLFGVFWTRTRAIPLNDVEGRTGMIELQFLRDRETAFRAALNELAGSLESAQVKNLSQRDFGDQSLNGVWERIRARIQAPASSASSVSETTALTKEVLESVIGDLNRSNERLKRGILGQVDLEADLGERILSARVLGDCTDSWTKLDKALRQRQKLIVLIEAAALQQRHKTELLACFGKIQTALDPLCAKYPAAPAAASRTQPENSFSDRDVNTKWLAVQSALVALQEGVEVAARAKKAAQPEVEMQQMPHTSLAELQGQVTAATERASKAEAALAELRASSTRQLEEVQAAAKQSQSALTAEHSAAMAALQAQLETAQGEARGFQQQLGAAQETASKKEEEIRGLTEAHTSALGQLRSQLESAQGEAKDAKRLLDEATAKVSAKDSEMVKLKETHVQEKETSAKKAQEELSQLRKTHREAKGSLETQLKEAQEELGTTKEALEQTQSANATNQAQYKKYKQIAIKLNKAKEVLEGQLEEKDGSIEDITSWIAVANEALREAGTKFGKTADDSFQAIEALQLPPPLHTCFNLISTLNAFINTLNAQADPESQPSSGASTPAASPVKPRGTSRLAAALAAAARSPQSPAESSDASPAAAAGSSKAKKVAKKLYNENDDLSP